MAFVKANQGAEDDVVSPTALRFRDLSAHDGRVWVAALDSVVIVVTTTTV